MATCFDPSFKYTRSESTDLRKRFKRIKEEQRKKAAAEAAQAAQAEFEENLRLMGLDYKQGDPYVKR